MPPSDLLTDDERKRIAETPLTAEELAELEAAAKAATPGPWEIGLDPRNVRVGTFWLKPANYDNLRGPLDRQAVADARYIARANPAMLLRLLAELRERRRDGEPR
jgi:hypothetical protein